MTNNKQKTIEIILLFSLLIASMTFIYMWFSMIDAL
jgi:hypothetical protein